MKYIFVIYLLIFTVVVGSAQTEIDTAKYRLDYLIQSGIKINSKLEPVEYQRKIELIKIEQSNKQPMPMFEFMVDYIPLEFNAKPEYDAFYSQRLVLPKKLEQSELSGQVKSKKQEIEKEKIRIDITRQIKLNYFTLYYFERLALFNAEYQKIMNSIIKSLEASYASGMGNQSQILKMNNELQMLVLEQIELEQSKKIYINNLSVLSNIGLPVDFKTTGLENVLSIFPELDSSKLISVMLSNNPEYKSIENMIQEIQIDKNISELERIPDITLRGGYKYMANENMRFLTIGIGIDLPFMPWNSKRINAMVEEKNVMELQSLSMKSSMYQYMKTELQNMLAMIDILKQKIQYIREIYIPQVRQTFNSSMASYSSGAGEFMNLLDSYREMRKSDEMLIKEETEYLKQLSELEFLLGIPVSKIN